MTRRFATPSAPLAARLEPARPRWRVRLQKALLALLLLLLPLNAAAGRDATIVRQAAHVEELLGQWQVDRAEHALGALLALAPDHPATLVAQGDVLFHRGEYVKANQLLERVLERSGRLDPSIRGLAKLVRATAQTVAGDVEQTSPQGHIVVRTRKGKDELLAPFVHETLERMRTRLAADLGYPPPERVLVEIYGAPEQLARVSPLTVTEIRRSGTIALCKYNRLMIVSPSALLRGYSWRDTLAHEYVHLVVSRATLDRAPIWLQEGLAKHFETRWRTDATAAPSLAPIQQQLLATALARRRLLTWQQMHPSMAKLPNQRDTTLAFAEVETAVSYLAQRGGKGVLRAVLDELRQGRSVWDAVAHAVPGMTQQRFNAGWRGYLRGLRLRRLSGLALQELSFGKAPSHEQQVQSIKQHQGRKHVRLAEMLRGRGLVRAAVEEYRRAIGVIGEHDPFVVNAMARAYLEIGEPERAISALIPVVDYYPELAGAQVTLALSYQRRGDRERAVEHFEAALRVSPFTPEVHCGLAETLPAGPARDLHRAICGKLAAQP